MGTKRLGGENFERRPVLSGLGVADVMYEVNGVLLTRPFISPSPKVQLALVLPLLTCQMLGLTYWMRAAHSREATTMVVRDLSQVYELGIVRHR